MDGLIENVIQALCTGLLVGCLYGLMCLGLALIFGIMRVINFAQGDLMMLGMYVAWYAFTGFGFVAFLGPYVGPIVAALLAGPVIYVFGHFLHKALISHVTGVRASKMEGEGHYAQLIMTLGISLIIQNVGQIVFGSTPISIRSPLSITAWDLALWGDDISVFINKARLIASVISILTAVALYAFISWSELGKSLRAAADNPTAATYLGIDVDKRFRIAFALGSAISAVAGGTRRRLTIRSSRMSA